MKLLFAVLLISISLVPLAGQASDPGTMVARGGELSFTFYRGNLNDIGLSVLGAEAVDIQHDVVTVAITHKNNLKFNTDSGYFEQLVGGRLPLAAGMTISAPGLQLGSEQLRIEPKPGTRDDLQLLNAQGSEWFYLDYGHYEREGHWLHARYLDVRIGQALASEMGDPALAGFLVGFATLKTQISGQGSEPLGFTGSCPVSPPDGPNWPTLPDFDSDIAMLKLDSVNQVVRDGGKVAIAPSAYFENIGNADVPWFAQFADTRNTDACCADQGDGVCAPYGNDQGGLLVYHLYRFVDGRLEQLAQSQVKHAFSSINIDTSAGSVFCRASNRSGRIVPSGCEDLYQASSNANQDYLGPREEIIAHSVIWLRDGSIWDLTGPMGVPDQNCDYLPLQQVFGGQVPCQAPVSGPMDRRLSVSESDLTTPGARYFIEAWYLAREDINIFNSFGRKEISPAFTTFWSFPAAAPFQQGPIIDDYLALQNANAGSMTDIVDSGEGQVRVSSTVSEIAPGQWQYDYAVMNFDFDRAVNRFDIPMPEGVNVSSPEFFDGDADGDNDWVVSTPSGFLRFEAPGDVMLKWGSLVSFRFVADRPPSESSASLGVALPGDPDTLSINILTAIEAFFADGFEDP